MELSHMETITRDMERRVMGMDLLMKEIGKMVNGMEKEPTRKRTIVIKEILRMVNMMDMDDKTGQMLKEIPA